MLIFTSQPGVVGAVLSGPGLPFALVVGGNADVPVIPGYRPFKAIMTGFELDQESGLGVNHTLRDRIYFYAFGDRAAPAMISGIWFGGVCGLGDPAPATRAPYTGLDAVQAYYERVRVSTQGLPVRLVFGPITILAGFLTGLKTRLDDPALGIGTFSFRFVTVPRNAGRFGYLPPVPWSGVAEAPGG